ncbi:MAG TPA: hypothetical protein VD927_14700 [Chryseosolibacter sp.]|nr:hypothetical protein [Chryseosolibacter sp.]
MKNYLIASGIISGMVSCLGIDDSCLSPDCANALEMRFNLVDPSGRDLEFDSTHYAVSEIQIIDNAGKSQTVREESVGVPILVVDLIDHEDEYQLVLKGTAVDTFKVSYRQTNEECCGETFWIEDVEFNLPTGTRAQNIGSLPIVID